MAFWETPTQQPPSAPFPVPTMRAERRRAFRRIVMRDGLLTPDFTAASSSQRAVVVDMTCFGVGLRMRENPEPGSTYTLTIPDLPDVSQSRIRIIESRPCQGDQYQVGAEFV